MGPGKHGTCAVGVLGVSRFSFCECTSYEPAAPWAWGARSPWQALKKMAWLGRACEEPPWLKASATWKLAWST